MAIRVEWGDEEQTILQWEFETYWTWSDYLGAEAESREILDAMTEPIDVILDLSKSQLLDRAVLAQMPDPQECSIFSHHNVRSCVITENRDFADRVAALMKHSEVKQAAVEFAEDCDTAYDLIDGMRQTGY
jgi:hypothetical protein